MESELNDYSRFLSFILRHKPGSVGLELDAHGWVEIDALVEHTQNTDLPLTVDIIEKIVATSDKQRFAISQDRTKIRANQGHSISVDLNLSPKTPPDTLYHGTAVRFVEAILKEGLKRGSRQHVHLSADRELAVKVGARHGKPVILVVDAKRMHAKNVNFYQSKNGVWLTDSVPAQFLKRSDC